MKLTPAIKYISFMLENKMIKNANGLDISSFTLKQNKVL